MAKSALRIFSPIHGFLQEEMQAISIKSREDARKVGPFCNCGKDLMYWVNWGTKADGKKIKPYFRRYSEHERSIRHFIKLLDEEQKIVSAYKHNDIHKKTQDTLLTALQFLLNNHKPIQWSFSDDRLTDFPLSGNLLSDVVSIEKEYKIKPPFVNYYSLDIALLGPKIHNKQIILGAIEIEYKHEVDLLKTLLCKSLGFPLFTLNIGDITSDTISVDWCIKRLTETTYNSEDGRRRNYIYIHNMLYPVYLSGYSNWDIGERHQYIIFAKDKDVGKLINCLDTLRIALKLKDDDIKLMVVNKNPKDKGSITLFVNEGALVGENWEDYNPNKFVRLILRRPTDKQGDIYKFHLVLTQLLTLYIDCLVGYKFDIGKSNFDKDEHIWKISRKEINPSAPPTYVWFYKRFCPKRISEPIREILKFIPETI
jgi:hypothetical protein